MGFDIDGARKEGYSDDEIADHLAAQQKFDIAGARKEGYTSAEILPRLLRGMSAPRLATAPAPAAPAGSSLSGPSFVDLAGEQAPAPIAALAPAPAAPKPVASAPDPLRPQGRSLGLSFQRAPAVDPSTVLDMPGRQDTAADRAGRAAWDSLSPQGQEKALTVMRVDASLRGSGTIAPSQEPGLLQRTLDKTVRKPLDNSLTGAAIETAGDAVRGVAKASVNLGQSAWGGIQGAADAVGAEGLGDLAGESVKAAERANTALTNKRDPNGLVSQVFESTFTSVPLVLGAPGAPLRAIMAQSAAQEYGQSRARGLDGNASAERAVWMGLAEGIGERFGLPQLQKLFSRAAGQATGKELGHILGDMLVKEQIGEQVTTALQSGYEALGRHGQRPGMTLSDYLNDAAETAKVTLGQSLLTGGLAGGVKKAAGAQSRAAQLAGALEQDIHESPDEALARAIDASPYGAARQAGFHVDPPVKTDPPVTQRKKIEDVFRNAAATVGMVPAAVEAAVKTAQTRHVGDIGGFLARFLGAARGKGLSGADVDPSVAQALAHGPVDATPQLRAVPPEAFDLLDGDGTGLAAGEQPAAVATPAPAEAAAAPAADDMLAQAEQIVRQTGRGSISTVQRHLRIGYNRAARLMEELEAKGVVGPQSADGARELLKPEPTAVDQGAHAAATSPTNDLAEPTDAQKEAGNYAKGHVRIGGLDLAIENPEGSVRRGVDRDGKAWESTLQSHYGYIKGTLGNDKDHVDAFVKPGTAPDYAGPVFVVDQVHPDTGKFDEHKVVIGAADEAEAEAIYRANYAKDWQGLAGVTRLPMPAFKSWVRDGTKKQPLSDIPSRAPAPAAPKFTATTKPDGTVLVMGTPADIKAALPQFKGIAGNRGISYGKRDAAAVLAALEAINAPTQDQPAQAQPGPAPAVDAAAAAGAAPGAGAAGVPTAGPAPAEAARVAKPKKRPKLDPERDTLLQAVAKMGGINRDELAREFGLKPEELKSTVQVGNLKGFPFRKTGGLSIDSAAEQLREAGYFDGVPDDEIRLALETAVYDELGGRPKLSTVGEMRDAAQRAEDAREQYEVGLTADESAELDTLLTDAGIKPAERSTFEDDDIPFFDGEFKTDPRALAQFLGETYDAALHEPEAQDQSAANAAPAGAGEGRRVAAGEAPAPAGADGEGARDLLAAEGLTTRERLLAIAQRLGVQVNEAGSGFRAGDRSVDIPAADADPKVLGAVSPEHIFAHELGHAVMQRRGMNFNGFPQREMLKWVSNWPAWVDASRRFRPAIHNHDDPRIKAHAKKPEEIIADAIGSVLLGESPESLVIGRVAGLTRRDLGLPDEGVLQSQSAEDLKAQANRIAKADAAEAAEQKRLTDKAKADAQRDEFTLTGSDSPADVAAAGGQGGLFDTPAPSPKPQVSENTIFTDDAAARARARLKSKLGQINSGIDPETLIDGITLAGYHIERGARTFAAYAKAMLADLGDAARPYLKSWYMGVRYDPRAAAFEGMSSAAEVDAADVATISADQGKDDVSNATDDLERDREDAGTGDATLAPAPVAGPAGDAVGDQGPGDTAGAERGRPAFDPGVPADGAAAGGERGHQPVHRGDRESGPAGFPAGADVDQRGARAGKPRVPAESIPAERAAQAAVGGLPEGDKRRAQRLAESLPTTVGDLANIRETLPYLLPPQQEDVHKAETRFAVPDGYGVLFTNGTGTGKTFTGLGVVKRYARQGKTDILVVVPDGKIMADWVDSARALGLTITPLENTGDAGQGVTITTYANLGTNDALASRAWDLIVPDEAHMLMQSADGDESLALKALRAISMHPRGAGDRYAMLNRPDIDRLAEISKQIDANDKILGSDDTTDQVRASVRAENAQLEVQRKALNTKLEAARKAIGEAVEAAQGPQRTRVAFLSATPFAYEKTIDWAEGYLFDYGEGQTGQNLASGSGAGHGYNSGDWRDKFFMQHFGYRMRYNKLTQPDAKVDSGLMQRQFNSWLKKRGALSGRQLEVDADYDRKFVLVDSAVGNEIDRAMEWIDDKAKATREALKEKKDDTAVNGFDLLHAELRDRLYSKQGHLVRRYLLEAIKAKEVVQQVRDHMAMGRKVVVFHDFKKGGATNPFDFPALHVGEVEDEDAAARAAKVQAYNAAAAAFRAEFPSLTGDKLLSDLISPIARFKQEFPGVLLINGNEKASDLLERYKAFQSDETGPVVALVQSAKNKGWSGHDTTGKHQRVLFNLGLPTQPTMSIQQEGRIYRTGQVSNAMFRYLNTGTNWERWAFAQTIAERASAAENLGSGELARALKDAFISGFEESGDFPAGHEGEGTGGKARDRAANAAISAYDRAKSFYFGTQKKTSKTKAQEGADYFATPEPVGFKMVEWADLRGGESALEPSGGHGAIARWFPENVERTAIEPSSALGSRMAMVFDGKIIRGDFEGLHVTNKFDAIVMNPPFGTAGRTAIDHLAKAATHLREGGRIVALIPTGPAADKKFDAWFYEEELKPTAPLYTDSRLGSIHEGDTLLRADAAGGKAFVVAHIDQHPDGRVTARPKGEQVKKGVWLQWIESVEPGPRAASYRPAESLHMVADIKLPQVTFERAATNVATRVVVIDKLAKDQPAPQQVSRDYSSIDDINELFDRLEDSEIPKRTKPVDDTPAAPEPARAQAKKAETAAAAARGAEVAKSTGQDIVEYTTAKGKVLRGVVRTDLTKAQAQQVDEYTMKSGTGWFIREKHVERLNELFPPSDSGTRLSLDAATNTEETTHAAGTESDAVRTAARVQGFVDRATGLPGEHKVTPVDGADAGPELRSARALARGVFGHPVQFIRTRLPISGLMMPALDGGKPIMVINVSSPKPVMAVMGHELLHAMRAEQPALYEDLKQRLDKVMKSNATYVAQLNARRTESGLMALDDDVLAEERIADVVGDQFTERGFWRDLASVNASGFRKLADTILGFLDDVIGKLTKRRPFGSDAYITDLKAARAAVVDAMSAFSRSQGGNVGATETRMSLGEGETAPVEAAADDGVRLSLANKTPEQREALARAGIGPGPTIKDRIAKAWGRAVDLLRDRAELTAEFRQGALDQFHGIKRAIERDVGALGIDQDPYVAARLANGGTSSVMRGLLLHGQAMWGPNGQHLVKKPGTKGLLDILAPLGDDVSDFFGWMVGNRAARLMREGRENNFTPAQIAELQGLAGNRRAEFVKIAAEYSAFKRSVLDVAEAAGLINAAGRQVWDHADYIPFYRKIDEKATFSPTGRKGLAGQSSGIRTLKGGTAALNDPIENLLMNFSRLIDASLKNNAISRTVRKLEEGGSFAVEKVGYDMAGAIIPTSQVKKLLIDAGTPDVALDAVPPEAFEGMARMWAIQPPSDPDVVRVMRDGKPVFYKVHDPLLLRALTSFVPFDFPGLGAARAFKRLLTATVTSTPDFMARNFFRDSAAAHAITREGFNPVKSLSGVVKSYNESGGYEYMLFAGASFQSGNINAADPTGTAVAVRRALRARGMSAASIEGFMATVLDTPAKFWEKYRHIGEAIENANREAVFEAAGKAGRGGTAAAFEAKDLMDFNLRGSWPAYQLLADVLPFFNARVQGLYRLGRSDPKRLAAVGMLMMAASAMLAFANDGEDWYEELPDWEKDTFWHFRIGKHHFKLPKPFELGVLFATIPERLGRSIKGLDTGKKTLSRTWANVRDQLAFDPVPQMFRPALNVAMNHDSFRDAPIENLGDEGKLPSSRFNARTSDTMRVLAQAASPVADATGMSPKRLEYLVGGYLGTVGIYTLGLADMVVRNLEGKPPGPELRADDLPVVKSFYRVDPARSTVYESDLHKLREEAQQIAKTLKAHAIDGDLERVEKIKRDQGAKLAVEPVVTAASKSLSQMSKARDAIVADPKLTPAEKREKIDALQVQRNELAKKVMTAPAVRATQ